MEREQNQRRGPAPHQVQGGGPVPHHGDPVPHQVQGGVPVPHQVQAGGPVPHHGGNPVPHQVQAGGPVPHQVQGGVPVPHQVALIIPSEAQFKAYEFLRFEPKFLKLPKRAPAVEATRFLFKREKDKTGNTLGDLLKRRSYYRADKVGDKRREILWVLPVNQKNEAHLKQLGNELKGLMDSLYEALKDLHAVVPTEGKCPDHFKQPPALLK